MLFKDVVLKAAEDGLAGSAVMLFTQGQSKCGVHPQMIGVIAVFIACCYLIDPPTHLGTVLSEPLSEAE
jgi:hypothetical protein